MEKVNVLGREISFLPPVMSSRVSSSLHVASLRKQTPFVPLGLRPPDERKRRLGA